MIIKTIYNESNACTFCSKEIIMQDFIYLLKPIAAKISIIEPTMIRLSLLEFTDTDSVR